MDATVIGRVAIKVVPDTSDFKEDAQRDLDAAERALEITVNVEASTRDATREIERAIDRAQRNADMNSIDLSLDLGNETEIRAGLNRIERELDRLRNRSDILDIALNVDDLGAARELLEEELANLQVGVELSSEQQRRVQRELDQFDATVPVRMSEVALRETQARLAAVTRTRIADIYPKVNEAALAKAEATLLALTGARAINNIGEDIARSLGSLDKNALKLGNISLAVANLSGYLLTATSNAFTFGASLASIGGVALAIPGILGGLGLGLGATVAVLKDFSSVLPDVGRKFTDLQDAMSTEFYDIAAAPFRSFIDTIFPQFQAGMLTTTSALGTYFGNLATAGEGALNGSLQGMFDDLGESILIAGDHTGSLIGIVTKLGQVGAGQLPALSKYFGNMLDDFDGWLDDKGPKGLQEYIDNGTEALKDFGGVLSGIGSIFAGVARAAENAGGSTLDTMRETVQSAADIVNGDAFQGSLSQTFRAAHEGMSELADAAGDDFQSLMHRLADTLDSVLPSAGRTLGAVLEGIFAGLNQDRVQASVVNAFRTIEESFTSVAGTFEGLGVGLAGVIDIAAALIETITGGLVPILDTVGPKFDDIAQEIVPLISALGDLTEIVATVLAAALDIIPAKLLVFGGALLAGVLIVNKLKGSYATLTGANGALTRSYAVVTGAVGRFNGALATSVINAAAAPSKLSAVGAAARGMSRYLGTGALAAGALALSMSGADEDMGLANTTMGVLIGSMLGLGGAAAGAVIGGFLDIKAAAKQATKVMNAFDEALANPESNISDLTNALADQRKGLEEHSKFIDSVAGDLGGSYKAMFTSPTQFAGAFIDALDGTDDRSKAYVKSISEDAADIDAVIGTLTDTFGNLGGPVTFENQKALDALGLEDFTGVARELGPVLDSLTPAMKALGYTYADLANADVSDGANEVANALADQVRYMDSGQAAVDGFVTSIAALDQVNINTKVSADALSKSLDSLLDPTLNAEEAMDEYHVALQEMNKQLSGNNAGFTGFSADAVANKEATRGAVEALKEYLTTQAENGASAERIANLVRKAREEFVREAGAALGSAAAAEARANALKLTPKLVSTIFKTTGIDLTRQQIKNLIGTLGKLPPKVQTYIENKGVPTSLNEIKNIDRNLVNLTKKQRRILIRLMGQEAVDRQLKNTKDKVDGLTSVDAETVIKAKDNASKVIDKAKAKAGDVGKQKPVITVSVDNRASGVIATISQQVRNLDAQSATITIDHITTYITRRSGGGGTETNGRVMPGFDGKSLAKQFRENFENAIQQMVSKAENAFSGLMRKFKSKSEKTKLRRMFVDDLTDLQDLQRYHARLMAQYDKAVDKVRALKDEMNAFKEATKQTIIATSDVTGFGFTYDGIVRGLEDAREKAEKFQEVIRGLIDAGLNETTLKQILAAGPQAGLAAAESILAGGVGAINAIQQEINDAAQATANASGSALYGSLITDAQKDVDKLLKELVPLQQKIAKFVDRLMDALRKQLKAKALRLKLGNIVSVNIPGMNDDGPGPKPKDPKRAMVLDAKRLEEQQGVVIQNRTLNYYAAPGRSLSSEEDLFEAIGKGDWL